LISQSDIACLSVRTYQLANLFFFISATLALNKNKKIKKKDA